MWRYLRAERHGRWHTQDSPVAWVLLPRSLRRLMRCSFAWGIDVFVVYRIFGHGPNLVGPGLHLKRCRGTRADTLVSRCFARGDFRITFKAAVGELERDIPRGIC